jgi:hypothetical protein
VPWGNSLHVCCKFLHFFGEALVGDSLPRQIIVAEPGTKVRGVAYEVPDFLTELFKSDQDACLKPPYDSICAHHRPFAHHSQIRSIDIL